MVAISTCIKSTGRVRRRVPRREEVGVATVRLRTAFAYIVVGYVQVVSCTKGWSVSETCVYGVTVMLRLDVQLNRSVAIDAIYIWKTGTIYLNRQNDKNPLEKHFSDINLNYSNTSSGKGGNDSYKYFVFEAGCFSPSNLLDRKCYDD